MQPPRNPSPESWSRLAVTSIEDLRQAVLGAGLDAVQLSLGATRGSLVFAAGERMVFSSGFIDGHVSLHGPLSESMTTLGIGLRIAPGSRHWMTEVETGGVGVFRAGDEHEAIYRPGTLYACVTLRDEHLEELAAERDLVLDAKQLGGSRISSKKMPGDQIGALRHDFAALHAADDPAGDAAGALGRFMLACLIEHVAREPRCALAAHPGRYVRIVAKARSYIEANLAVPIYMSALARAACASQSTLYRAFHEVLDETPQSFVRKLRLNRLRRDLASEQEARCTITMLANKWGVAEAGRCAGWYRELFGELPSQTRARRPAP